MTDLYELGRRIYDARLAADKTLTDVADAVGVAPSTIQRYEQGKINRIKLPVVESIAKVLGVDPSWLLQKESSPLPSNISPMPDTYTVPLLGEIACGKPILAVEDATETVDVPSWVHADFALKCKGDSMINARIFDGDIVYIRKQSQVDNGQIAAVRIGEEATLKKVYYTGSRITLRAANPLYEDLVYEESQLDEVEILGKAVAFTSMIR